MPKQRLTLFCYYPYYHFALIFLEYNLTQKSFNLIENIAFCIFLLLKYLSDKNYSVNLYFFSKDLVSFKICAAV